MNLHAIKLALAVAVSLGVTSSVTADERPSDPQSALAAISDGSGSDGSGSRAAVTVTLQADGTVQTEQTDGNAAGGSLVVKRLQKLVAQSAEQNENQDQAQESSPKTAVRRSQVVNSSSVQRVNVNSEDGAASFVISTQATSDGNSDETPKIVGKIVLTTPDGKVVEYDLNQTEMTSGFWTMDSIDLPLVLGGSAAKSQVGQALIGPAEDSAQSAELAELTQANEAGERLMLGVHCETADELLRKHLKSGDNGLAVLEVVNDSAAAAAGIVAGDILLQAGDMWLTSPVELLKAVKQAGETEMPIVLIREGDKMSMTVTPRLTKVQPQTVVMVGGELEADGQASENPHQKFSWKMEQMDEAMNNGSLVIRQFSPGIVIGKSAGSEEIARLVEEAMKAAHGSMAGKATSEDALKKQIEELEKQIEKMAGRIAEIENRKSKSKK